MRFNDKELAAVAQGKAQVEGRLQYRSPPGTFREAVFRERYFKLVNNLLFYFRLNEVGQIDFKEPVGVLVLENYSVRIEKDSEFTFAFGILFLDEPDKRHIFTARSDIDVNKWVHTIRQASYQHWKNKLSTMQSNITALKAARESMKIDKSNPKYTSDLNDLTLLDLTERQSDSPLRQRHNPFLPQPHQSPKVPPRTNSPSIRRRINNNNESGGDLIKF